MRELQDKIKNGIANSYHLRSLAKDDCLTLEQREKLFTIIKENDKRIKYYKIMNNILREQKNGNNKKHL